MALKVFTGSGVAIVTPFNADSSINYTEYEKLIEFQIQNSTDAIVTCGTTGEASTLTDDEQIEVIRFTVDVVKKRVPVVAGTGSNDTGHGVKLAKEAQRVGADACLIISPYYNKTTQKGLILHLGAAAKAVDIPCIIYNVPGRTGMNIDPKTVKELMAFDNIVGIKEASGNLAQIMDIAELCGDRMALYSGNDDNTIPILSMGGQGLISVVANVIPKDTHDMITCYLNGDTETALRMQLRMLPLCRASMCEVNPIPIKAALRLMGYQAMYYRSPLCEMGEENFKVLNFAMKDYGLL
ncbi:MAG: 4-hydroxy-tetrahydrodipicolinate synthase [Peptococcaceae bacterium]|jgi:4-hydroxy-tetrahydrodipicolinate synthase|nr:4-hydroxy-tetrahydrodipicolinate synthase [Peptococcaceae bacterium]